MNDREIETYAVKITEPDFEKSKANVNALIGHLDAADRYAVLTRAAAIERQLAATSQKRAEMYKKLHRLAVEAACPDGEPVIPWLEARGLDKRDDLTKLIEGIEFPEK